MKRTRSKKSRDTVPVSLETQLSVVLTRLTVPLEHYVLKVYMVVIIDFQHIFFLGGGEEGRGLLSPGFGIRPDFPC
jgi:hypothetical protein